VLQHPLRAIPNLAMRSGSTFLRKSPKAAAAESPSVSGDKAEQVVVIVRSRDRRENDVNAESAALQECLRCGLERAGVVRVWKEFVKRRRRVRVFEAGKIARRVATKPRVARLGAGEQFAGDSRHLPMFPRRAAGLLLLPASLLTRGRRPNARSCARRRFGSGPTCPDGREKPHSAAEPR
jgi:hypothetical protein